MSNIKKLSENDPEYQQALELTTREKNTINYKELASKIINNEEGTIIRVRAPKMNYSNIKVALGKRKLVFDVDYTMTFSAKDDQEVFYITVKG